MIADKMGIIPGKSNYFYPDKLITREEMAVIVLRALKAVNKPFPEHDITVLDAFTDKKSVSSNALQSISSIFGEGVMSGKTKDGKRIIAPKDAVPRADAATVIYKVLYR